VATAALYAARWKVEGSAFNGREPDEHRLGIDLAPMDSWSARAWWLPSAGWAVQVSTGHLNDAERDHDGVAVDVRRTTASLMYHRAVGADTNWSSTIAWGRNAESVGESTNAFLFESSAFRGERDAIYARFESGAKSAHDLALEGDHIYQVSKAQAGYTKYVARSAKVTLGVGGGLSLAIVPDTLRGAYGRRLVPGINVHVSLMPRAH
jgi:hypothetical protein